METTPFATYLADQSGNKKVVKRVNRAIKRYRHANHDVAHAAADLSHAKEDCEHALQTLDETLAAYKTHFENWLLEDEEGIEIVDEPAPEGSEEAETADKDDDDFLDHDDDDTEDSLDEALSSLEHAARDFKHAIKDARHAADDLDEVEYLLLEVMDFAEDDGIALSLVEAKAYIAAQAAIEKADPAPAE